MKFGLFGMNVTGGLVMTKFPQWKPSFEKIAQRLQMVERCLPDQDLVSFQFLDGRDILDKKKSLVMP